MAIVSMLHGYSRQRCTIGFVSAIADLFAIMMIQRLWLSGVRIVNTSDASLVDEVALADALKQGQVHAAALDVYNTEPFHRANSTSARL